MISQAKHILLPTDFSECSKNALNHAALLADKFGARITLLNVIDPPFNFPTNVDGVIDYLQENAEQHLERLIEHVDEQYPKRTFKLKHQIRIGKPISQILEAISDLNIDLVVLGSAMDAPTRKVLFGSVSTDVILRSTKPVLAVPEGVKHVGFEKILFTTNFRHKDLRNLEHLAEFAKLFNSEIHVLHVTDKEDLETDIKFRGMKELVKEKKIYKKIDFELKTSDDAFIGISEYVNDNDISMMVMNRYIKSVIGLLLDKNYAKKMSIYSTVPLLVLIGE
ncbi:MAG: universal stress protein [Balneolaceae bacterium]|nr:MAG: universal stress protein [Balneolaceae bacterium]